MTAKEFLSQAAEIHAKICRTERRITELRAMAERSTSTYEATRTSGTVRKSKIEDAVVLICEEEDKCTELIKEYLRAYHDIKYAIEAVDNEIYRRLLSYRYLDGLKLHEVAVKMHYSRDRIKHLHGKALKKVKVDTK